MKKLVIIMCIILAVMILAGCEVVSERIIDCEFVPAYDAYETVYGYKYSWYHGDFMYVPELKMVHHDDEYRVQYERVWSDGSVTTDWKTVTKEEYEQALKAIGGEDGA